MFRFSALLSRSWVSLAIVLVIIAVQVIAFFGIRNPSIDDIFHLGEAFAAATTIELSAPGDPLPFTIHGALNFWPYFFVEMFEPDQEHFLTAVLVLLGLLGGVLAIALAAFVALRLSHLLAVPVLVFAPFLLFVGGFALSHRDILFLTSFLMLSGCVNILRSGLNFSVPFLVLFGVVSAVGVYWSFDRGLAIILCVGLPLFLMAFRHHMLWIAVASFFVAFLGLPLVLPGIGVLHYFDNLHVLLLSSESWRYPETDWEILSFLIVANVLGLVSGLYLLYRVRHDDQKVIVIASLCLAIIMYYKIGTNRLDLGHYISAIWVPLLLVASACGIVVSVRRDVSLFIFGVGTSIFTLVAAERASVLVPGPSGIDRWDIATASLVLLFIGFAGGLLAHQAGKPVLSRLASLPYLVVLLVAAYLTGSFAFHAGRVLDSPALLSGYVDVPPDRELVSEDVLWLSDTLRQSDAECLFDFVNIGVINQLAGLPACTQFTYPVYASSHHEERIVAQLAEAKPPVVLASSDYWSYSIDGKSMQMRYPLVQAFIEENYPIQVCEFGHCLRYAR